MEFLSASSFCIRLFRFGGTAVIHSFFFPSNQGFLHIKEFYTFFLFFPFVCWGFLFFARFLVVIFSKGTVIVTGCDYIALS